MKAEIIQYIQVSIYLIFLDLYLYAHAHNLSRDHLFIYYHFARTVTIRVVTCNMMYPEFLDHSNIIDTTPVRPNPPPYVPPATSVEDDDLEVVEEPPPAYLSPRASATIFTTAYPPPIRNRTVRTVNPNVQIPDTYPGFAFCKFTPGKLETVIRLTVVVRTS